VVPGLALSGLAFAHLLSAVTFAVPLVFLGLGTLFGTLPLCCA